MGKNSRAGSDLADLGIDAIRLVAGPSRIGCRIDTIGGVDLNDFHADRISSAKLSTDRVIVAERWCKRLGAAFSIVSIPIYLAADPFPQTVQL